jgi:hypothetical protein
MDNDQIVSRMNSYLHTSANVLAEWGCRTKNGVTAPFSCEKHKSQTTKSPAFAVKYIYATK